jgi:hypothetical protein
MNYRLVCLLLASLPALAEDRALILGIGEYPEPNKLPGIHKDVEMKHALLRKLGFVDNSQVHVLEDKRATYAAIRKEMAWLAEAGPNDRVVFYYSGHGSIATGPDGKAVGVLLPIDVAVRDNHLVNVLSGPELAGMLARIPSQHVLVVIDACHSGQLTAAKGVGFVPKFYRYKGMPDTEAVFSLDTDEEAAKGSADNHLLLAACKKEEVSYATPDGSVLTVKLAEVVSRMIANSQPVNLNLAHREILAAVQNKQHPEISGKGILLDYDWSKPAPVEADSGDWLLLKTIYEKRAGELKISLDKPVFRSGDAMSIRVDVPSSGYLNVVSIGRGDQLATVLFPNRLSPDNRVEAGSLVVPGAMPFTLEQELPQGMASQDNELVVVFTAQPVNYYREGEGKEAFRQLGARTRSTVVKPTTGAQAGYSAGFATYQIGK